VQQFDVKEIERKYSKELGITLMSISYFISEFFGYYFLEKKQERNAGLKVIARGMLLVLQACLRLKILPARHGC